MRINVLGETEVISDDRVLTVSGFGGVKTRQILEILVLHRRQSLSKERLVDLLWEGRPPRDHMATLESYVSVLRARLQPGVARGESVIVTGPGSYSLDCTRVSVDLDDFDRLVELDKGLSDKAGRARLLEALALVRGPLLSHELYGEWAASERGYNQERVIDTLVLAAELSIRLRDFDVAVRTGTAALRLDPLAEGACQVVMRAHWAAERPSQALRCYETFRRDVRAEIGIEPGETTRSLFLAIVSETPSSDADDLSHELGVLVEAVVELHHRCRRARSVAAVPAATSRRGLGNGHPKSASERLLIDLVALAQRKDSGLTATA